MRKTEPDMKITLSTFLLATLALSGCVGPAVRHESRVDRRGDRYENRDDRRYDRHDNRYDRRADRGERVEARYGY